MPLPEWSINYIGIFVVIVALMVVAHAWARYFDNDRT